MDLATITMERDDAHEKYLEYRDHGDTIEDAEIARGYRALAAGHAVLRLDDAIKAGGVNDLGQPRLAVMRADLEWCYLDRNSDGSVTFNLERWPDRRRVNGVYWFPAGTLPTQTGVTPHRAWSGVRAMVPTIPPRLRPGHHLRNYEVLWEVDEWTRVPQPPGDPALLKHLGGQLYAVLATWDLTPLEQAVLAGRIV